MSNRYALAMVALLFATGPVEANAAGNGKNEPAIAEAVSATATIRTGVRIAWSSDGPRRIVKADSVRRDDVTRHKVTRTQPPADPGKVGKLQEFYYVDFS